MHEKRRCNHSAALKDTVAVAAVKCDQTRPGWRGGSLCTRTRSDCVGPPESVADLDIARKKGGEPPAPRVRNSCCNDHCYANAAAFVPPLRT